MKKLITKLRNNFISGLLALFPLIVSILFIRFLYLKLDRLILEPVTKHLLKIFPVVYLVPVFKILVFIFTVIFISLMGFATKVILTRRLISSLENLFMRLPLFGKIYKGTKEISDALLWDKKGAFRKVVLVEFPREGSYSLGFITSEAKGELQKNIKEEAVTVFIPTAPNPTSGFVLFVPLSKLLPLEMSVEEGIKLVISFGMVSR
ncbi:MAG: DUF502 domain-containing protein [Candidatus Omnitrophica bacterium]|nr:DUF502 domain-containing protein [Candidatus Omnitrophota bacterium]MCM8792900.1 DUF502 domain-containing protein [Candidatus Omnitrophota bacterium]